MHADFRRYRWAVLVLHRRFGKTVWGVNELIRGALTCERERPRFVYLAPLRNQAKSVAWDYLRHYTAPVPGRTVNESELRVDFPNGGRVQLFGSDNPDAMRGIYCDGVFLDEYAQMSRRTFTEVLRPALSDRLGWAIFSGTPQGKNAFHDIYQQARSDPAWMVRVHRASETGIISAQELEDARSMMSVEEYQAEYECSFSAGIPGAYYAKLIEAAEDATPSRITTIPIAPELPVHTAWDLGIGDSTCIWFAQQAGRELRLVDYYEASGEPLSHYARVLQERGYLYGDHIAPHDIEVRELGTGKSRKEVAAGLGIRFQVAPKLAIEDGIEAVRNLLPRCWFDAERCKVGIDALKSYRRDRNERTGEYTDRPLHDWSSHAADAMRYLAVGFRESRRDASPIRYDTRLYV